MPLGSVKNQLMASDASTAQTIAGSRPPTSAVATVRARKSRTSSGSSWWLDVATRPSVTRATPTVASSHPPHRRRGPRPSSRMRSGSTRPTVWLTRWTSMSPEAAATCSPTPRRMIRDSAVRRLVPRTICEALTPRAKSRIDSATSLPATSCMTPPSSLTSFRCAARVSGSASTRPSGRDTWHASSSPPAPRLAIWAARRSTVSLSGTTGERDDDAFAGGPGRRDAVRRAVALERLVDTVGQPQQRQLAQGREVARAEVVRERGVDAVGGVDVPVRHPAAQRLRRHVDQLDLVGGAHDVVRDGLALHHSRDRLDDVVERLEVLDVHGRDDVDAGVEQDVDVLPPLAAG